MNNKNFDELDVTTMTVLYNLNGIINLDTAFLLLPLADIKQENDIKKKKQRTKTPFSDIPGSIVSLRYKGLVRGYNKKKNSKISSRFFKNSITLDISIKEKNINVKLCRSTIHMCGVKNINQSDETVEYLIKYLYEIYEMLKNSDKKRTTERLSKTIDELKINHNSVDFSDLNILYDDFKMNILETDEITVSNKIKAMVNYNYDLGFIVDRYKLNQFINGRNGFYAHFDNSTEHFVTIELPYESTAKKKNKNKRSCHKFLIYKSGLVTQTGPNEESMKPVYESFISLIQEFVQNNEFNLPISLPI